jgi:hypothetical protein
METVHVSGQAPAAGPNRESFLPEDDVQSPKRRFNYDDVAKQTNKSKSNLHVGFVVDKVALDQVFSEHFGFPSQSSFQ